VFVSRRDAASRKPGGALEPSTYRGLNHRLAVLATVLTRLVPCPMVRSSDTLDKSNPVKAGAAKPRVLASSATPAVYPTTDEGLRNRRAAKGLLGVLRWMARCRRRAQRVRLWCRHAVIELLRSLHIWPPCTPAPRH